MPDLVQAKVSNLIQEIAALFALELHGPSDSIPATTLASNAISSTSAEDARDNLWKAKLEKAITTLRALLDDASNTQV